MPTETPQQRRKRARLLRQRAEWEEAQAQLEETLAVIDVCATEHHRQIDALMQTFTAKER